jgi:hypothetical protein
MANVSFANLIKGGLDAAAPRTTMEVLTFLAGFTTFEWFVHESASALPGWFCHLSEICEPAPDWEHKLVAAAVYFASFLIVLISIPVFRPRRKETTQIHPEESPPPIPGLIVSLSDYKAYASPLKTVQDVKARLKQLRQISLRDLGEFRAEVLASNLGPLYNALQHHQPELRHCWLTYTPESADIIPVAMALVKLICPQATPHRVKLHNANNVSGIARRVREIFDSSIGNNNLTPEDVMVDITGGNVTMSAGLVLASIDENRKVQYLRQTKRLAEVKDGMVVALAPQEAGGLLQYVRTTPGDVRHAFRERES